MGSGNYAAFFQNVSVAVIEGGTWRVLYGGLTIQDIMPVADHDSLGTAQGQAQAAFDRLYKHITAHSVQ